MFEVNAKVLCTIGVCSIHSAHKIMSKCRKKTGRKVLTSVEFCEICNYPIDLLEEKYKKITKR